jgi:hypothetical protein
MRLIDLQPVSISVSEEEILADLLYPATAAR